MFVCFASGKITILINFFLNSEATVLYAKASLFAHSCVPNCTWSIGYSPNFTIRVRASKIIEKGDILFVSYNPNWGCYGALRRRAMIQEVGGFRCNCSRCMDPTELNTFASSLKCGAETCNGYVVSIVSTTEGISQWQCTNNDESCQNVNSKCDFTQKTTLIENEWDEIISTSPLVPIPGLIQLIEKFISYNSKEILHPNHWLIQQASLTIVRALGSHIQTLNLMELQGFITHCQYLIKISDVLNPGISLQRALIQLYLSRALFLHYKISTCKDEEYTIDQIHQLEEIRSIQLDSFLYWKDDIQSKCLNETMGFEATQLNNEIHIVYQEYERTLNNICFKKIEKG